MLHLLDTKIGDVTLPITPLPGGQMAMSPTDLSVGQGSKFVVASNGDAELNQPSGRIITDVLDTAPGEMYVLILQNSVARADDILLFSVAFAGNASGFPVISTTQQANGSITFAIRNVDADTPFNGTLQITFLIVRP